MQKVFSLLYNQHPLYLQCLNLRKVPGLVDHQIVTKRVLTKDGGSFWFETDIERIDYLQKNPNSWYLDADVIVNKWPDFKMDYGVPYVSCVGNNYDTWAIMGIGCQWFYDYLMEYYYKCNGKPEMWWSHKKINGELKKKIKPIPEGYFRHLMLNGIAKRTGDFKIGGLGFTVERKNDTWALTIN
jgi:hypothetical protein